MNKSFLILLFLIIISQINNVRCDAESKALEIIDRYRDIARYTFFTTDGHLERYPEGFCGGTPVEDCKWDQYIEAIILLSGITFVIAAITLVFGIIFWIFRCLCFGGCKPTHGFMCPRTKYDPDIGEGYTSGKVLILKLIVLVFVAGCVAVFITSLKGNSATTSGINNLSDTILDKTSYTLSQLQNISQELNSTKYEQLDEKQQIQTQLADIIATGTDVQSKGEDISDNVKKVNDIRTKIIVIGLVFCMVVAGVIGVSALIGLPKIARLAAILLVILIPFMWIVFSVHYPINSVIADICTSYNETGISQFSNFSNPIVDQVFEGCHENENSTISVFIDLENLVDDLFANGINKTCGYINDACQKTVPRFDENNTQIWQHVLDCNPNVTCSNSTLSVFLYNSTVHDFKLQCILPVPTACGDTTGCDPTDPNQVRTCDWTDVPSIDACQADCANNDLKSISTSSISLYQALLSLSTLWWTQVVPLIKCSFLMPFINEVQDIVCVDEVNSLDLMIAPTAIFAILLTGLGIMAVLGTKRFNSHYKVKSNA